MPWERVKTQRYFRIHQRQGKKRLRIHFGRGDLAELACLTLKLRHEKRLRDRQQRRMEKQHRQALEADINMLARWAVDLQSLCLLSLGYHRRQRRWMLRRTHEVTS